MAMITCGECNREISDRAATCPGCGAPVTRPEEPAEAAQQQKTTESSGEVPTTADPTKPKRGSSGALLLGIPVALLMAGGVALVVMPRSEKQALAYAPPTSVLNEGPQVFSEVWNKVVVREEVRVGRKLGFGTTEFEKEWQVDPDLKNPKRDTASFRAGTYRTSFWDVWLEVTFEDSKLTTLALTCELGTSCALNVRDAQPRLRFLGSLMGQVTSPNTGMAQIDGMLDRVKWANEHHLRDISTDTELSVENEATYASCLRKIDGRRTYVFEVARYGENLNHCRLRHTPL